MPFFLLEVACSTNCHLTLIGFILRSFFKSVFFDKVPWRDHLAITQNTMSITQYKCRIPRCRQHFVRVQRVTHEVELVHSRPKSFESSYNPPVLCTLDAIQPTHHRVLNLNRITVTWLSLSLFSRLETNTSSNTPTWNVVGWPMGVAPRVIPLTILTGPGAILSQPRSQGFYLEGGRGLPLSREKPWERGSSVIAFEQASEGEKNIRRAKWTV